MNNTEENQFIFNWILKKKLAVGTTPIKDEDLVFLKRNKVINIIGLCSEKEIKWHENLCTNFNCERIFLPDSHNDKLPCKKDFFKAFEKLKDAVTQNITFVHCFASIERSPLLCIMYIMYSYNLNIEDALDYVRRIHKHTNPTNRQLRFVKEIMLSIDT